jgi:segregation and condensation protein B
MTKKVRDTDVVPQAPDPPTDPHIPTATPIPSDLEATVDLRGPDKVPGEISREQLKGLMEALVFASDRPLKTKELAKIAGAQSKLAGDVLSELVVEYESRGIRLEEIAGGWIFRTAGQFSEYVRELTKAKPVRLSRAQVETVAIIAYRQPVTRPEIDDVRGVDSGAVLKTLLERDLIRILGHKDEPGRPILYGTGAQFLELFALKSLGDLPTLREFTELNEESRRVVERELGEAMEERAEIVEEDPAPQSGSG